MDTVGRCEKCKRSPVMLYKRGICLRCERCVETTSKVRSHNPSSKTLEDLKREADNWIGVSSHSYPQYRVTTL